MNNSRRRLSKVSKYKVVGWIQLTMFGGVLSRGELGGLSSALSCWASTGSSCSDSSCTVGSMAVLIFFGEGACSGEAEAFRFG